MASRQPLTLSIRQFHRFDLTSQHGCSGAHLVVTMTALRKSVYPQAIETGHIDLEMIHRHVPDGTIPVYCVAAPPQMVVAVHDMLVETGVSTQDICAEEVARY